MKSITNSVICLTIIWTSIFLSSCGKKGDENGGPKIQPGTGRLETLKPTKIVDAIQVAGIVKASEDVNISPEEGGVVKEWKVKKGDQVNKGQVIVVLKDEV